MRKFNDHGLHGDDWVNNLKTDNYSTLDRTVLLLDLLPLLQLKSNLSLSVLEFDTDFPFELRGESINNAGGFFVCKFKLMCIHDTLHNA